MRRLTLALLAAFALTGPALAEDPTGIDWQLLAIDGKVVDIPATLRIEAGGSLSGHAPCNSFGARNLAQFPDLELQGIRSTKRACDRLDQEQAFFSALKSMTRAEQKGGRNLVLTGPDGRSMEFVTDLMNSLTVCTTCPKDE